MSPFYSCLKFGVQSTRFYPFCLSSTLPIFTRLFQTMAQKIEASATRRTACSADNAVRPREVAGAHDVAIVENPPLARTLHAAVEIDREVPAEHYKAVAEVIGYVMRLNGSMRR